MAQWSVEVSLLRLIAEVPEIHEERDFDLWLDRVREILPFRNFGFGYLLTQQTEVTAFWPMKWFPELSGFQESYMSNLIYEYDPLMQAIALESPHTPAVRSWSEWVPDWPNRALIGNTESLERLPGQGVCGAWKVHTGKYAVLSLGGSYLRKEPALKQMILTLMSVIMGIEQIIPLGLLSSLSDRQFEMLRLMGTSLTYAQIGDKLGIRPSTVEKHFSNIKHKTGILGKEEIIYGPRRKHITKAGRTWRGKTPKPGWIRT